SVRRALAGCTHVVHLVAIIRGSDDDFRRVMVDGFRNVLDGARESRVERVVLMSALGTGEASKDLVPYYGAKWEMERAAEEAALPYVVCRPSFVLGCAGGVLPTFVRQVRWSPVVTVIGSGRQQSEPIWIEDVAAYFAAGVESPEAANRT